MSKTFLSYYESGGIRKERSDGLASKASVTISVAQQFNYKKKSQKSKQIEKVRYLYLTFFLSQYSDFLAVAEAEGFEPSS
ncbi:MAG: hypothetical protein K2O95_01705, partial [Clostridia bacterium]|nr:hypothetical protein [Clostridia bacterium]